MTRLTQDSQLHVDAIADLPYCLRRTKTLWSFVHSECNRVKDPRSQFFALSLKAPYHDCISDIFSCIANANTYDRFELNLFS